MKFHIVQVGEDVNKICEIYNIDRNVLEKLRVILKEDKKIVDDISSIYTSNEEESTEDEKYICPHCKNIILIPKK